jgi:hypothetical protein
VVALRAAIGDRCLADDMALATETAQGMLNVDSEYAVEYGFQFA